MNLNLCPWFTRLAKSKFPAEKVKNPKKTQRDSNYVETLKLEKIKLSKQSDQPSIKFSKIVQFTARSDPVSFHSTRRDTFRMHS